MDEARGLSTIGVEVCLPTGSDGRRELGVNRHVVGLRSVTCLLTRIVDVCMTGEQVLSSPTLSLIQDVELRSALQTLAASALLLVSLLLNIYNTSSCKLSTLNLE